jgi:hypothetical protein
MAPRTSPWRVSWQLDFAGGDPAGLAAVSRALYVVSGFVSGTAERLVRGGRPVRDG